MSLTAKGLLQKINFIEIDMDLHKQILVSIPSKDTDQIETVVQKIADQKKQIDELRMEIKKTDADEYNKIIAIEKATQAFQQIAVNKKFVLVSTLNETGECFITLNDDTRIDCLVAAQDDNGNWTIMTPDGETKEYPGGLIK
ncbi:MAG: hypothetical protein ABIJ59_01440 [Pseudomonadota bacterium]